MLIQLNFLSIMTYFVCYPMLRSEIVHETTVLVSTDSSFLVFFVSLTYCGLSGEILIQQMLVFIFYFVKFIYLLRQDHSPTFSGRLELLQIFFLTQYNFTRLNFQKGNNPAALAAASAGATAKLLQQPSISITPLPRQQGSNSSSAVPSSGTGAQNMPYVAKPGRPAGGSKTTFVICEICDGYIKVIFLHSFSEQYQIT